MEQIGTPEEVYHGPATTFVASFIGSPPMNLMTGQARWRELQRRPAARWPLPARSTARR